MKGNVVSEKKKVIETLTEAQTKQLAIYRDKWISIGLRTGPANRRRSEGLIADAYRSAKLKPPKQIIWFPSPFAVDVYLREHKLESAPIWGQHEAGWLSFYDFMYEVLELKETVEPLRPIIELAKEVGWYWCFDKACLVSERPVKISLAKTPSRKELVLHDEYGPAILYADGACGYYLNGVRMVHDKKMRGDWVETPADKLDPKCVLEADNVEVRRELIRKLGIDRVYETLKNKTVHKFHDYELVDLNITDDKTGRYLKMINPSIGTIHLEGVPNECKTVQAALAWRDGEDSYTQPEVLT